ncbi:outer membrane protein [Methylobacterium sp. Leaf118]|uniref:outer membrane protein n=1 Tax=Methylobacterium sp. Leaf118 TaxID=2876562 RepID=UPI001E55D6DF|nr:porin family protein [Methylobacterium sp. Leaf118]
MIKTLLLAGGASLLAAGAVQAADLPRRQAPPPVFTPVPVFTWTGFYAGFNAGYAWSERRRETVTAFDIPQIPTADYLAALGTGAGRGESGGFTGGAQIGYNIQFTPGSGFVFGIEADAAYTDLQRRRAASATIVGFPGFPGANDVNLDSATRSELSFLGTVRGRVGYAFDRFLIYGTGGFAYGQTQYSSVLTIGTTLGGFASGPTASISGGYDRIQTGYAYGGGIEYALPTDNFLNFFRSSAVTLKVEYLHFDLGRRSVIGAYDIIPASGTPVPATVTRVRTEGDLVRAGINYKFGTY